MSDDLLVNAERPVGDKPRITLSRESAYPDGYWPGSAAGEVLRWRDRALAAEAEVRRLQDIVQRARVAIFGGRAP